MRKIALFLLLALLVPVAFAQQERPWTLSVEFGDGQLKLTSDQQQGTRGSTFALGIIAAHRLSERARVGVQAGGWLLQAFNLNNPTVGVSVSNVMGVVDVFPVPKQKFFLRGGAGLGMYTDNHPNGTGGHGFAWTVGAGYEIPLTKSGMISLAPIVAYSAGSFGDAQGPPALTNRRYSVVEFKAALVFHFGRKE